MRALATRGEPPEAHGGTPTTDSVPDWESVRQFIEVVRRGSIRSAADHMSVSSSALRRRIAHLEQQLSTRLITRHIDGVRLTPEGQQVFDAGCRMEAASFGLIRAKEATAPDVSGEVKIAVTEGTGTFCLAPRLVETSAGLSEAPRELEMLDDAGGRIESRGRSGGAS